MSPVTASGASAAYPAGRRARDRFVLARRGSRKALDPFAHQGVVTEPERSADGTPIETATVFLTGRECPWRCVMCDLWTHTTAQDTPAGAIARQVSDAVIALRGTPAMPAMIKLYNAGSFFDGHAVPPRDDEAIAEALEPFTRVIVESHPSLVGDRTWRLRDRLGHGRHTTRLEVAMGLETAHPSALERLNKGITIESFATAALALAAQEVDLRVFLLIHPPFVAREEQDPWLARSIATAFECGATVVSLIPTRGGNGAMEALQTHRHFAAPSLIDIERSAAIGLTDDTVRRPEGGRVFVDAWDLERFATCPACAMPRRERLIALNLDQRVPPRFACTTCGEVTPS
jgi:radical SAM enzyme (TIGR01210 family)